MPIEETVDRIRDQDGIVYLPHPFDWWRFSLLWDVKRVKADIVEVYNSKCINGGNFFAQRHAKRNKILMGAGSDAHFLFQIGKAYVEIEAFNSKKEFLKNFKKVRVFSNVIHLKEIKK